MSEKLRYETETTHETVTRGSVNMSPLSWELKLNIAASEGTFRLWVTELEEFMGISIQASDLPNLITALSEIDELRKKLLS